MGTVVKANGHSVALLELGQTIGEAATEFNSNGATVAVVCQDSQYVGLLRRDLVSQSLSADPKVAGKNLEHLGPLPSPFLPDNSSPLAVRRFINEHELEVIPFMDRRGRLTRLLSPEEALNLGLYENAAVVMAGGFGYRLRPITENIPKPMVPLVTGKLLDRIIDHLLDCGFYRQFIAVHYLMEQVMEYLGDGGNRGLSVNYLVEETPLGTAGSLRSLAGKETMPVLVTNGDVITNQRFGEVLRFHNLHKAEITIVCKEDSVDISYGVVEQRVDGTLKSLSEKPSLSYLVNTGLYFVNPDLLSLIPDKPFNMTDLIKAVQKRGGKVSVFVTREYWRDVGTIDCYAQVMKDIRSGLVRSFEPPVRRRSNGNGAAGNGTLSAGAH